MFVHCLALWHEFVIFNPLNVKKHNHYVEMNLSGLPWTGGDELFHWEDCCFVSGLNPYTHVLSLVITIRRNWISLNFLMKLLTHWYDSAFARHNLTTVHCIFNTCIRLLRYDPNEDSYLIGQVVDSNMSVFLKKCFICFMFSSIFLYMDALNGYCN